MNRFLTTATVFVIVGIPTIFFLFYGRYGAMWEYVLIYLSDIKPGLSGFLYPWDSLRIFTNFFYHIGYWISKLTGQAGSWAGYHIIYCTLIAVKGLLVFLVCRLVNLQIKLAVLAAAVSVLHAADHSLGFVSQLNPMGITVWVLLSMCSFLLFLRQKELKRFIYLCTAAIFSYMALWSHEGALVGLLLYPVLFLWISNLIKNRIAQGGTLLVSMPAIIYLSLWAKRILSPIFSATYQGTVMRDDIFDLFTLLGDFWILALHLFNIPSWLNNNAFFQAALALPSSSLIIALIILIYFSISLGINIYFSEKNSNSNEQKIINEPSVDIMRLVSVLCLLTAAFLLPYLALKPISFFRTQILAAPFASILSAMTIEFIFIFLLKYIRVPVGLRCALYSMAILAILSLGFVSIATRYQSYNYMWEKIRFTFARLLQTIPSVHDGTIIMLQNVPVIEGLWEPNYCFDKLLRITYPYKNIAGSYSFNSANLQSPAAVEFVKCAAQWVTLINGKSILAPHGTFYLINGEQVTQLGEGNSYPMISSAFIQDVIVLEWTDTGLFKIIRDVNQIDSAILPNAACYNPDARINAQGISPLALRRFVRLLPEHASR